MKKHARWMLVFLVMLSIFPGMASAEAGSEFFGTISLTGTVRDFQDTHPDFEKNWGMQLGLVNSTLGADRKPVYSNIPNNAIHSADSFKQWYNDVPGINQSRPFTLDLTETIPGTYRYDNGAFFPIDDQLFGNQGRNHNYHFTYELHTQFTYNGDEHVLISGDDDIWLFIDGKLAIDLGGLHSELGGYVDLDDLGLNAGETYTFDLFFAERHTTDSTLRIETNFAFQTDTTPPVTDYSVSPIWVNEGGKKYIKGYTVTLTATDDSSGVNYTKYRVNNGAWKVYTGPFELIGSPNAHLDFYSVDNAGNQEANS